MPRVPKPLTDTEIKQAKPRDKEYNLSDGNQLALRIKPNGTKIWLFNYVRPITKARTNVSLGMYPVVTLAAARKKADEIRLILANGIDPKDHKEQKDRERERQHYNTFESICKKWLETKIDRVGADYYNKITSRLETYIFPKMGKTPVTKVDAVTTIELLTPLAKADKLETVKKLCAWLNQAMDYAVNTGFAYANPLKSISKAFNPPEVTHQPTISPKEIPDLMYRIQHSSTKIVTRCLIEWQLHTMVRPVEAAEARWSEIDEANKTWTIPRDRMKTKKNMTEDHVVPLTKQTLRLLEILKPITGNREYIFPGDKNPREPANSQTVNRAIKRMGYEKGQLVSHGFRALASTTLNEQGFDPDIIEKALAHKDRNTIRGIYNRAQYLEQRRDMMQWWSDHLESSTLTK